MCARTQGGFTTIELMVAMSVVGVLAAIAFPRFTGYKSNAFDSRAEVTLRHVATAEEAYFSENEIFVACDQTTCSILLPGLGPLSRGVILNISLTPEGFQGTATHPQGSGTVYTWNH